MQKIAIISTGESGCPTARVLEQELQAKVIRRDELATEWQSFDAFIFIGALGICVRSIAPLTVDKYSDPAVVCVDSSGMHAISVLSGHIGGGNELTERVAKALGAEPVITTRSDTTGLWALDLLPSKFGWEVAPDSTDMNQAIFKFVNQKPTALMPDVRDAGTQYLERTLPGHVTVVNDMEEVVNGHFELVIAVSPFIKTLPEEIPFLQFVPKVISLGIGLARQASPTEEIHEGIRKALLCNKIWPESVMNYATVDIKSQEPYVRFLRDSGQEVIFYTADELDTVEVPNPSDVVSKHVGTASVSEASAMRAADGGHLVMEKVKGPNFTVAAAVPLSLMRRDNGHIEIVGAGPGDPELISIRGRRLLEQADLILYAGSLVPRELTLCAKPDAVVRSSATMTLEEQCQLMKSHYDRGQLIVRLHTGDPCIFGAIQEQMAFFDANNMSYHITPGISSFLAAAAELRSQFTIPERCQTIILTRGEGRTPMPEREKLHLLAKSRSTMCIFLSAAIADEVQKELLTEYPEDTPVAVCYHLTWRDQRIYRGTLKNLAHIVREHNLTLTTMLVVGEAIDNRKGLSELYSKDFTHLFRKSENS